MTTVVYFNGTLAADRQCSSRNRREGMVRKVAKRRSDGALVGGCGTFSILSAYIDWFLAGECGKAPSLGTNDDDDCEIILVRPTGKVVLLDRHGAYSITTPALAMGSGCDFAYGALEMGATAEQAVRAAIRRDTFSGGGVRAVRLD